MKKKMEGIFDREDTVLSPRETHPKVGSRSESSTKEVQEDCKLERGKTAVFLLLAENWE